MQNYELILKAPISNSFMAKKAMQSVDLDAEEKSWHRNSLTGGYFGKDTNEKNNSSSEYGKSISALGKTLASIII